MKPSGWPELFAADPVAVGSPAEIRALRRSESIWKKYGRATNPLGPGLGSGLEPGVHSASFPALAPSMRKPVGGHGTPCALDSRETSEAEAPTEAMKKSRLFIRHLR